MLDSECQDYRLQHFLKATIAELPYSQQLQLKSVALCNSRISPHNVHPNIPDGVFLAVNNQKRATFFGQVTCKNPWICPHCSAVMMSKYASKIGSALDMFREQGLFGFMITFTIPHLAFQKCSEVTDVLYQTWRNAFANAYAKRKTTKGVNRFSSPINKFFLDCEVKNYVRVAEFTYGSNGWHPHFHCIFWIPREKKDLVLNYEKSLNAHWDKKCLETYQKYWEVKNLHINENEILPRQKILEHFQLKMSKAAEYGKPSVQISKTREQKIRESLSSDYIAGWGDNKELTGNVRKEASHQRHYTPHQILEMACNGKSTKEKYLQNPKQVYIDFMLAVSKKPVHHRVDWSKPINKLIVEYRNKQGYQELIRKKKQSANWRVVAFFTKQQWYAICDENFNSPILSNIIYLAKFHEELLADFLLSFGIEISIPPCYTCIEDILNGICTTEKSLAA